jgi:hypothetical protein
MSGILQEGMAKHLRGDLSSSVEDAKTITSTCNQRHGREQLIRALERRSKIGLLVITNGYRIATAR